MSLLTKTCDKCQEEFDIDEIRVEGYVAESRHPEDRESGNTSAEDEFVLCSSCYVSLKAWFRPDVDSVEEMMEKDQQAAHEALGIEED